MESVMYRLSKQLALKTIKLAQRLMDERHEFILSKQLYRSASSIGANLAEAEFAQSAADYISKLKIALKEANYTKYWMELIHEAGYIADDEFDILFNDIKVILGTLVNSINKIEGRR